MRKLIAFDDDTFDKLTQLGRDRMATLQELADEAFADLLKKHGIPIDLKDALRKSAASEQAGSANPAHQRKPNHDSRSRSVRRRPARRAGKHSGRGQSVSGRQRATCAVGAATSRSPARGQAKPKVLEREPERAERSADLLQAVFEARSVGDIEFRRASHLRDLRRIERADHPRR